MLTHAHLSDRHGKLWGSGGIGGRERFLLISY